MKTTESDDLASARAAARSRVLREFEQTQSGLSTVGKAVKGKVVASTSTSGNGVGEGGAGAGEGDGRGVKRKFELEREEIDRLTKEGEEEAMRRTAIELAESRRAKLPAFWLVSDFFFSF